MQNSRFKNRSIAVSCLGIWVAAIAIYNTEIKENRHRGLDFAFTGISQGNKKAHLYVSF